MCICVLYVIYQQVCLPYLAYSYRPYAYLDCYISLVYLICFTYLVFCWLQSSTPIQCTYLWLQLPVFYACLLLSLLCLPCLLCLLIVTGMASQLVTQPPMLTYSYIGCTPSMYVYACLYFSRPSQPAQSTMPNFYGYLQPYSRALQVDIQSVQLPTGSMLTQSVTMASYLVLFACLVFSIHTWSIYYVYMIFYVLYIIVMTVQAKQPSSHLI